MTTDCDDCGWQACLETARCIRAEDAVDIAPLVWIGVDLGSRPSIGVVCDIGPDGKVRILKFGGLTDGL